MREPLDASQSPRASSRPFYTPWRLFALTLLSLSGCVILLAATLALARQQPPSAEQRKLSTWAASCWLAVTPAAGSLVAGGALQGAVPGVGPYQAQSGLVPSEAISLADAALALGQPERGCLDYGLHQGKAVVWLRLLLSGGKIEVLARLSPLAERVLPETPIQAVYCYSSPDKTLLGQTEPWRGFVAVDTYHGCRYSGTAVPQ